MSLKDAMAKAGLKSTKTINDRQYKRDKNKAEKFQEVRIFCEVCETTQQDVERYFHKMPLVDAEWICSNCADKNSIHDDCRQTRQSPSSKSGMFRRYYGPLKDFSKDAKFAEDKYRKPKRPGSNSRKPNPRNANPRNNRRPQRDTAPKKKNYIIDENGEKNFNC